MSAPEQLPLPLPVPLRRGRHPFLISASNADAYALVMAPAQWPGPALSLWGPPSTGKTLLANTFVEAHGGTRIDASELDLALAGRLRHGPVTLDHLEGLRDPVAAFHLFNAMAEGRQPLLLVARCPAGQLDFGLNDLRTRLRALPVAEIGEPDDALLTELLSCLLEDRQIPLAPDILSYLTRRMERSAAAALSLAEGLAVMSLSRKGPITREAAASVLSRLQQEDPVPDGNPPER